jgi:uncharacterized membrane protein YedE/YeeE
MDPSFTPLSAMVGGALIGLAAVVLLIANERIAGVSGIVAQMIWPGVGESRDWRVVFVLGLLVGSGLVAFSTGGLTSEIEASPLSLVIAGLLVGFGTRLGGGCTSGHGVCGMARISPRSIAATLCFMAMGMITVYVVRHWLGGAP